MSHLPLGILSSSGGAAGNSLTLISTVFGNGSSTTLTFNSIPQTYNHLQLRFTALGSGGVVGLRPNGYNTGDYRSHRLAAFNGSISSSTRGGDSSMLVFGWNSYTDYTVPASGIVDLLDYTNTNKSRTIRAFAGNVTGTGSSSEILLTSGFTPSDSSAITSLTIYTNSAWTSASRFSLYGVK